MLAVYLSKFMPILITYKADSLRKIFYGRLNSVHYNLVCHKAFRLCNYLLNSLKI